MMRKIILFLLLLMLVTAVCVQAQEMRRIRPVRAPSHKDMVAEHEGRLAHVPAADIKDFSGSEVRDAVSDFAGKWNSGQMADTISDGFYDKSRLVDAMEADVPKDANMKINAVKGMQTVDQRIVRGKDGILRRISTVTVIADTQLDFNDSSSGFVSVPGTNEFVFTVTEKVQ